MRSPTETAGTTWTLLLEATWNKLELNTSSGGNHIILLVLRVRPQSVQEASQTCDSNIFVEFFACSKHKYADQDDTARKKEKIGN